MPTDAAATGVATPAGEVGGAMGNVAVMDTAKAQPDRVAVPTGDASSHPTPGAETVAADESAKAKEKPPTALPAGSAGLADKSDGILLRYNEEKREWERLLKLQDLVEA